MKRLFFILLIAILIVGCKTTKTAFKEHLKTDLTTHVDSTNSQHVNQHTVIDSASIIAFFSTDHTDEKITRIEFAKPDSTGKQAILSETVTERTHDKDFQQHVKTNVNTNSIIDKKQDIKTNKDSRLKSTLNVSTTTKTSWSIPWWVYLIIVGLVAILGFSLRRIPYVYSMITWIKNIFK